MNRYHSLTSILFLILLLFPCYACKSNLQEEEIRTVNSEKYEIIITLRTQNGSYNPIEYSGDTVVLCQSLSEIAKYCANPYYPYFDNKTLFSSTFYRAEVNESDNLYYVTIIPKSKIDSINYSDVLRSMMNKGYVESDTSFEKRERLVIVDADKYAAQYQNESGTVANLYLLLRDYFKVPLIADEEINLDYTIKQDFYKWLDLPLEEFCNRLKDQYGIGLKKQNRSRVQVVTFKCKI